jgi:hypothetical protein
MASGYLHNHKDFSDLLNIISLETKILVQLIEKDYWIMHVLHSLKSQGFQFELKATSKNLFYVSRQLNSSKTRQIEGA